MRISYLSILLLIICNLTHSKKEEESSRQRYKVDEINKKLFTPTELQRLSSLPPANSNINPKSSIESAQTLKKHQTDHRNSYKADTKDYCETSQPETECSELDGDCLDCDFDRVKDSCIYGKNVTVRCSPKPSVVCKGDGDRKGFEKEIVCQYCYQTPSWQQICSGIAHCNSVAAPKNYIIRNCTVLGEVLCFGNRRFLRNMPCNWKNGYKWSTTLFLSVTLGGFGADRFYLGRWQEGIGKLFSFGGLGLWTFVDIILIGVRYLGPADGSLYVD